MGDGEKKGIFSRYLGINLLYRILGGLLLGAAVGIVLGIVSQNYPEGAATPADGFIAYTRIFGDIFIRLLKMIVVPVIFCSLVCGAAAISPTHLGRVGLKIFIFYLVTSALAVIIGLVLANAIKPGLGFHLVGVDSAVVAARSSPGLYSVFLGIIPVNPLESLAKGDLLPIIFFALAFGISVSLLRDSGNAKSARAADALLEVFTAAAEAMYKIVAGVMQFAPIGVFVLIAAVFAQQGPKAIGPLLLATSTTYLGFALHLFGVYGGILLLFGLAMRVFLRKASEVLVTAFVTRSSSGTLPVTLRVTEEKMGVPRSIASFSLPLGATINMDGTAIYLGVCSMFIGFAVDAPLTFAQQATVVVTATLASIGTAGVPGAGAIMLLMVMDSIGLPVEAGTAVASAYTMILGIDALLDMGRTALNVSGDVVGTLVVTKTEGMLDASKWEE